ncbi:uncharacterized protein K460DRAFT_390853 [Cucurbitaria berberidis CBS 394.84]|uniref:Rhodopsin domain-containing protein n=1 Tax=Cucurbitaria berberidis CBS 394.84 TaxID=1168544 RepID=A0A9P4LD26_9PLEO|nr:uncharacterized protein K460DRAFT_390853 [Cucurbitaria berberidis CBS 394.84]KAF1850328.1 hypothetical protein K460DRAFT_390853 [Cucurbitaria berberidis CBS 394.84]
MSNVNGTITMIPPPKGYVVNFANPARRLTTETYTIFIVENILAIVFLAQRLYTKVRLMKQFQIDDVTVLLAWVLSVTTQALLVAGFIQGCIGAHAFEIPIELYGYYSRLILAAPLVYAPCCALTKITLCLFYRRLSPNPTYQAAVWATIFLCAGAYTGIFFSLIFACKPIAASWNPLLLPIAKCSNRGAIYIATAVIGVVTDVMLMGIPVPTIWGLQMPTKQKVGLTAIFAIGSITMVTSIIRLVVLIPSLTNMDQTWVIAEGSLWIIVEANLFIVCCCLPTLRRFFRHVAPHIIGESSGGDSEQKDTSGRNRGLRTWGSLGPKRPKFDTLMNTVDGMEGEDYIPLSGTGDKTGVNVRESKIRPGNKEIRGDNDSEEAILYERTVQVTYGGGSAGDPAVGKPVNPQTQRIWAEGQNNRA